MNPGVAMPTPGRVCLAVKVGEMMRHIGVAPACHDCAVGDNDNLVGLLEERAAM